MPLLTASTEVTSWASTFTPTQHYRALYASTPSASGWDRSCVIPYVVYGTDLIDTTSTCTSYITYDVGTTSATTTVDYVWGGSEWGTGNAIRYVKYDASYSIESLIAKTPAEKLKELMANRLAVPNFIRNRKALDHCPDIREIRARQTLLRVIGEEKYRNFIKNGFITVRAKSGKAYQIFPGHGMTKVYYQGCMLERLCVVLSGDFPPTDSLIMRYLLILNNEDQFRSLANVSRPDTISFNSLPKQPDSRSLAEIFASYKKAA